MVAKTIILKLPHSHYIRWADGRGRERTGAGRRACGLLMGFGQSRAGSHSPRRTVISTLRRSFAPDLLQIQQRLTTSTTACCGCRRRAQVDFRDLRLDSERGKLREPGLSRRPVRRPPVQATPLAMRGARVSDGRRRFRFQRITLLRFGPGRAPSFNLDDRPAEKVRRSFRERIRP
jgi:hypothetical protein